MKKVSLIIAIAAVFVIAFTIALTNSTVNEVVSNYIIKDARVVSEEENGGVQNSVVNVSGITKYIMLSLILLLILI